MTSVQNVAPRPLERTFPPTDMSTWLMLALVSLALPRTILEDLDVVAPERSWLYFVLALTPFAVWLAVAILRETSRPLMDYVVLGVLYGLSLALVHQLLWDAGASLGQQPPAAAVSFAADFDPSVRELAVRAYTVGISMVIGIGTGIALGVVAMVGRAVRSRQRRTPRPTATHGDRIHD